MKLLISTLSLILLVSISFGQIKYEKGYLIKTNHSRIECLIKNMDAKNNPKQFSYKLDESGESMTGTLDSVIEFGIYNYAKFINIEVDYDHSSNITISLTNNMDPVWVKENLFLKVIVEGKVSLYSYNSPYGERYFYSVNNETIKQLIYKRYKDGPVISENNSYKDQLIEELNFKNCNANERIKSLKYTLDDLKEYFKSLNSCLGSEYIENKTIEKRNSFNLKFAPGLNCSTLSFSNDDRITEDFSKTKVNLRLGLEAEMVLPFNNGKLAIVIEPTWESCELNEEDGAFKIKYSYIEFPIGMRYYFYLNPNSKLYLNGFYVSPYGINLHSVTEWYRGRGYKLEPTGNWSFGGGITHKRFSMEARYHFKRELIKTFPYGDTNYSAFSLIFGYQLFKISK